MPSTSLDTADAVELADLLQFLDDWLATDHDQLSASLAHFAGSQACGVETLRDDLARVRVPARRQRRRAPLLTKGREIPDARPPAVDTRTPRPRE